MVITKKNLVDFMKQQITLHDGTIETFSYDYDEGIIFLQVNQLVDNRVYHLYTLTFYGVLYCEIQNCKFFGQGDFIYWAGLKNEPLKLHERIVSYYDGLKNNGSDVKHDRLEIDTIFYSIQMNSGDTISIICENLEITEQEDGEFEFPEWFKAMNPHWREYIEDDE